MTRTLMPALLIVLAGMGAARGQSTYFATAAPPPRPAPVPNGPPTRSAPTAPTAAPLPVEASVEALGPAPWDGTTQPGELRLGASYALFFFATERSTVPLGTTALPGLPGASLGAIGDRHYNQRVTQGGQFSLGYWGTEDNPWAPGRSLDAWGIETKAFFIGQRGTSGRLENAPILARPFFDLNNNRISGVIVAAPGLAAGSLSATTRGSFWGAEANYWQNIYFNVPGTTFTVDLMTGLRYLNVSSNITVERFTQYNAAINPALVAFVPFAGNRIQEREAAQTHNHFYGGQLGVAGTFFTEAKIKMTGRAQLGLGVTTQSIRVEGFQMRTPPGGPTTTVPGALLALPSNIGVQTRNRFAMVPELGLDFEIPLLDCLSLMTGFNALYWNRILLPGDQIDRSIDISQVPNLPGAAGVAPTGLNRPSVPFRQSQLWVLSLSVGAEFKW